MATLNDGLSELLCLAYGEPADAAAGYSSWESGIFAIEPAIYQHPPSSCHEQREDGIKGIGG